LLTKKNGKAEFDLLRCLNCPYAHAQSTSSTTRLRERVRDAAAIRRAALPLGSYFPYAGDAPGPSRVYLKSSKPWIYQVIR
jgi:hypothetical protein